MKRIGATAQGRVQGVGFRYYARDVANRCRLTGWVRNLPDGSVELEAQGPADLVDTFVADLRAGPPLSYVAEVTVSELPIEERERDFEVRY